MLKIKLPSFTAARSSVPGAVTPVSAAHTVPAPAAINSRLFGQTGGAQRGNASLEERERQGYTVDTPWRGTGTDTSHPRVSSDPKQLPEGDKSGVSALRLPGQHTPDLCA